MEKFTSVDYLRALSMLYIVGYWHLFDYTSASLGHSEIAMEKLTHVVLAIFVLVSGFFVGGRSSKLMSATQFYKRRLLRIYPLYALAITVFYIFGMNDGWVSVKALFGISMYSGPTPLTLWFVTMLLLFYLVTPLLLMLVNRTMLFACFVASALAITLFLDILFESVDLRLLLYFPSFCLGVYCAHHGLSNKLVNLQSGLFAAAVGVALTLVPFESQTLNELKDIPLLAAGAYLVLYVCVNNEAKFRERSIISFLSYSGFSMFLFHRPLYGVMTEVYLPANELLQVVYLMTVCLFVIALVAWGLQKSYDLLYAAVRARWQVGDAVLKT